MGLNIYKWSIVAMLTMSRVSCHLLREDTKDSTDDEAIMESINLAALGVAHSYDALAREMKQMLRLSLPEVNRDAASKHFDAILQATKTFADEFEINTKTFFTFPLPQMAQAGIYPPQVLLKDRGLDTLVERIERLGDTLTETRNWLRNSDYYNKKWFKNNLDTLPKMALADVPAVWILPLDRIYVKLNIQDPSIAKGEIYNRKMGLLGVVRFRMVGGAGMSLPYDLTTTRGYRLLLSSALGLMERMFDAIKKNVTSEQLGKIDTLYKLYKAHVNLGL